MITPTEELIGILWLIGRLTYVTYEVSLLKNLCIKKLDSLFNTQVLAIFSYWGREQ